MDDLLKNAKEFLESGEENIKKRRYNASVSDFFKAITILCDYLIYKEIKILPKNHNDRFFLLKKYFVSIHDNVSELFKIYIDSYNLRLKLEDALKIEFYAYGLKKYTETKK
ncbi:hypothetical protein J4205_00545 [Candidatus Pacearchaeota archaeon]|nr:hypothetical protein [Candidatus Pacearchaeota archaeon]